MNRPRVLVINDQESVLSLFAQVQGAHYNLTTANEGAAGMALVAEREFDVVVTDLRMPGASGFSVLESVKARWPETEVVFVTSHASVPDAVEAIKQGAYDYIQEPFDPEVAVLVIDRALERRNLRRQMSELRRELHSVNSFHNMIGKSQVMREVYGLLERAAGVDMTILLTGEAGTGKELAARAIHYRSDRRHNPFVAVNCGALPIELLEVELFGHAKGAFSGATGPKPGLFEEANHGTVFLDEVGEMPLALQAKMNRVLQDKVIRRVGENTPIPVDVRIVAATHRDLKAETQGGRFREDFFYRLHVFPIRMPALRDRREDIPALAAHFLSKHARNSKRDIIGISNSALRVLVGHNWSGNVRELENAIERAVAIAASKEIDVRDLPNELRGAQVGLLPAEVLVRLPYREAMENTRDRISKEYLTLLMREFEGNVTRAADRAGVERESLHRLLKRYGVRSDDFKKNAQA
jgi:two-component system response regulator HydG